MGWLGNGVLSAPRGLAPEAFDPSGAEPTPMHPFEVDHKEGRHEVPAFVSDMASGDESWRDGCFVVI